MPSEYVRGWEVDNCSALGARCLSSPRLALEVWCSLDHDWCWVCTGRLWKLESGADEGSSSSRHTQEEAKAKSWAWLFHQTPSLLGPTARSTDSQNKPGAYKAVGKPRCRTPGQKLNWETLDTSDSINQMALTDIHGAVCLNTKKCMTFPIPYGKVSKIDLLLGHKTNFRKHKNIEVTSCSFWLWIKLNANREIVQSTQTHRN